MCTPYLKMTGPQVCVFYWRIMSRVQEKIRQKKQRDAMDDFR